MLDDLLMLTLAKRKTEEKIGCLCFPLHMCMFWRAEILSFFFFPDIKCMLVETICISKVQPSSFLHGICGFLLCILIAKLKIHHFVICRCRYSCTAAITAEGFLWKLLWFLSSSVSLNLLSSS